MNYLQMNSRYDLPSVLWYFKFVEANRQMWYSLTLLIWKRLLMDNCNQHDLTKYQNICYGKKHSVCKGQTHHKYPRKLEFDFVSSALTLKETICFLPIGASECNSFFTQYKFSVMCFKWGLHSSNFCALLMFCYPIKCQANKMPGAYDKPWVLKSRAIFKITFSL